MLRGRLSPIRTTGRWQLPQVVLGGPDVARAVPAARAAPTAAARPPARGRLGDYPVSRWRCSAYTSGNVRRMVMGFAYSSQLTILPSRQSKRNT